MQMLVCAGEDRQYDASERLNLLIPGTAWKEVNLTLGRA